MRSIAVGSRKSERKSMADSSTREDLDMQRSDDILKKILSTKKGQETLLHSSSKELGLLPRKKRHEC